MRPTKIEADIASLLQRYVYALVDPRDGVPFYIGKGTNSRVLQHGLDATHWSELGDDSADEEHAKLARINSIRSEHLEPEVWILRYGMTPNEYSAVEATVIDLLRTFPIASLNPPDRRRALTGGVDLTNKVRGSGAANGVIRLSDLVREFSAPKLTAEEPLLLVTLGQWTESSERLPGGGYRTGSGFKKEWVDPSVLAPELGVLGESVCCWWKLNELRVEKEGIRHMVACYRQVTRGLFKIEPDSLKVTESKTSAGRASKRKGFSVTAVTEGPLWEEVIGPNGHRIPPKKRGEQAQYRYWPYPISG
ncbi:LEM-3-like GIY-YIG domain-containing protein [Williamsia sp. MIQD14]|uniref:LEM-3-like GIY-YIG domain-containing protein n=1 Tax=Williamsia sp. MIQD14 TaxID=3425703 RepID=UPI003DA05EFE